MSLTYLYVTISHPSKPEKKLKQKFLIDSGAVYTVIDKALLKRLGIKPHSTRTFILANGEEIKKQLGDCFFEFQKQKASAPVVFGDKDIYLLGATTLENLGLILNPIDRELKPLPMII